jgi:hypothetical protein
MFSIYRSKNSGRMFFPILSRIPFVPSREFLNYPDPVCPVPKNFRDNPVCPTGRDKRDFSGFVTVPQYSKGNKERVMTRKDDITRTKKSEIKS